MKIADMPAGPEMDRLVAEKVMGWKVETSGTGRPYFIDNYGDRRDVFFDTGFYPSSYISDAWEVLERMDTMTLRKLPGGSYACAHLRDGVLYHGLGESAPLAICRAALIAVGVDHA